MPKYLESIDHYIYSNNSEEEEELNQPTPELNPQQTAHPTFSEPNSHPTHPLTQTLFRTIYARGFLHGSNSTYLHQLSNYLTTCPIFSTTILIMLLSGSTLLSKRGSSNSTKKLLIDSSSPTRFRTYGTSLPTFARKSPSYNSNREVQDELFEKFFKKFEEKSNISKEYVNLIKETISAQTDGKDPMSFGLKDQIDQVNQSQNGNGKSNQSDKDEIKEESVDKVESKIENPTKQLLTPESLLDALKMLMENDQNGGKKGNKAVVWEFNPDKDNGISEPKLVNKSDLPKFDEPSSIPSTYLSESPSEGFNAKPKRDQTEIDKINSNIHSQPMAKIENWSKIRFEIVEWAWDPNGTGESKVKLWSVDHPDKVLQEPITVQTECKNGKPVQIYHNGLFFGIDQTPDDLPNGSPIWRFTKLIKDVGKEIDLNELEDGEVYSPFSPNKEDPNEPNIFDNIILSDRENNDHIFQDPVPSTNLEKLQDAIEQERRVEFWLDDKLGNSKRVKNGKVELWKIRVGIYTLYDKPEWSEFSGLVYLNGPPLSITINQETGYNVEICPGENGEYLVEGQEEYNDND